MSKKEYLYPMEVQVYQKIKWYTEKGELHCCYMSNEKLGELLGGRNKSSISRTISKLVNLGYVSFKQKNPRQLITTQKKMIFKDYQVVTNDDETVIVDDKVAIVDDKVAIVDDKVAIVDDKVAIVDDKVAIILRLLDDETVIATMTKLLSSDDKTVNHKNRIKNKILNNICLMYKSIKNNKPKSEDVVKYENIVSVLKDILFNFHKRAFNTSSWSKHIKLLVERDNVDIERINKALLWYKSNIGNEYVPVIQSGSSLREKFSNLEQAMSRDKTTSSLVLTEQEKQQRDELIRKREETSMKEWTEKMNRIEAMRVEYAKSNKQTLGY
ncbi:MAG: hypothetical protein BWY78_00069 [Alphaproteobacteria bacterium ADurb.Bin438]|nr:MAG: hypothetical protein BWY78_00069 [Alphaproteobacteria bacterium ADurb.Bin438]